MPNMTYYVVLRDERNNLVRVPTHTSPTVLYGMDEPTRYTGLLLQCEGLIAVADDGTEQRCDLRGSAWLRTADDHEADAAVDFELMMSRRR